MSERGDLERLRAAVRLVAEAVLLIEYGKGDKMPFEKLRAIAWGTAEEFDKLLDEDDG